MFVKGISELHLELFVESPTAVAAPEPVRGLPRPDRGDFHRHRDRDRDSSAGGVGIATWLTEYAHPRWLARAVESGIEMIAGVPSIVLALFGLLVFSRGFLSFLSPSAPATAR